MRTDDNQTEIVAAFRAMGCAVLHLHTVGGGCPDLLVHTPDGLLHLVEVKDGAKVPSARRLTSHEANFIRTWPGPVYIVADVDQAAALVAGTLEPVTLS